MIKIYAILLISILMTACGQFREIDTITQVVPGPIKEVPVPNPSLTFNQKVEMIIAEKNLYRQASGQLPLTRGLTCTLHNSNNPDLTVAFPSASHTFTHLGNFNQPNASVNNGMNVIPVNLRPLYINNYLMRCQGQIVVVESGYYLFKLSSDDGSMLYINGSLTINNNFNHGVVTVQGSKLLEKGIHSFRLDFGQTGGGNQALILESSSGLIPESVFYR